MYLQIIWVFVGKYQLRVDLSKWDGSTISATYDTFKVAPASDDYRLSIGDFNRIAGDIGK